MKMPTKRNDQLARERLVKAVNQVLGLEPLSWFGRAGVTPPPLEYYAELYVKYLELKVRYGLPWPKGLGEAGPGISKAPATGFMDMDK